VLLLLVGAIVDHADEEASAAFKYQVDSLNRKSSTFKLSVLTARLDADDSYAVGSACTYTITRSLSLSLSLSLSVSLVALGAV